MELGKRPGMQTALSFPFFVGDTLTNIRQVLKHDGTPWCGSVCTILFDSTTWSWSSSLPKQLTRTELLQVPCSRFGAFGLQLATKTEDTTLLLFPPSLTQERAIGGHSRVVSSPRSTPITSWRGRNVRGRDGDHDMQEVAPLAVAQIGTTDLAADVVSSWGVFGTVKPILKTPCYRCQTSAPTLSHLTQ